MCDDHPLLSTPLHRYCTKKEKTSEPCGKLLDLALKRAKDKEIDDDDSAVRLFSSYLYQQVGGRDWSAQEVRICGCRTIATSVLLML